ncbi:MAG: DUF3726 domain-containing protein [Pseudomonadota bacterium]
MTLNLSLNEVDATARKATRGAGYPWGIAEEAGKAVRWLCAQGIDGCAVLAEHLNWFDGADLPAITPTVTAPEWHAAGGTLCPLMTGTAFSDRALALRDQTLTLGLTGSPALLIPFAAQMARQCCGTVTLHWPNGSANTDGDALSLQGGMPSRAAWVRIAVAEYGGTDLQQIATRATPAEPVWDRLNRFAHRTYAPATEESRLKGAGAGRSDRD